MTRRSIEAHTIGRIMADGRAYRDLEANCRAKSWRPAKHVRIGGLLDRVWNGLGDVLMALVLLNLAGLLVALAFDRPTAGLDFFIGLCVVAVMLFARLAVRS